MILEIMKRSASSRSSHYVCHAHVFPAVSRTLVAYTLGNLAAAEMRKLHNSIVSLIAQAASSPFYADAKAPVRPFSSSSVRESHVSCAVCAGFLYSA